MADTDLTDEDTQLWQSAVSEVAPLKGKKKKQVIVQTGKPENIPRSDNTTPPQAMPPPLNSGQEPYLAPGDMRNVDGSIAEKLKRGTYPIDATLDLHGRTQDEAFEILRYFIHTSYQLKKRCICVITGKGIQGEGVLRSQLPKWLNLEGTREYTLAYTHSIPQHGGDGAFYILLKKNK